MELPPGPREPKALQTVEWIVRPGAFLRRCAERYGEPFTLRTHWADQPVVLVSHPDDVKAVFTGDPAILRGGGSGSILEPFAGPHSILLLDGSEHLTQRRRMLPPFHGDRMRAWRPVVAELAREELASWPRDRPVRTHARMQALTLEVMLRVVFGSTDERLRRAITGALELTRSAPRLVAMSLGARRGFERAVAAVDEVIYEVIETGSGGLLDELRAVSDSPREVRDQLVTLLAAGHETTATALAWAFERLGRRPDVVGRLGDDAYRDATVKEILRVRPVLSIAPRTLAAPFEIAGRVLPAGVQVAPCIYLTHRREDVWGDPLAFRPERFLDRWGQTPGGAPGARPPGGQTPGRAASSLSQYAWIPFGGGTRRCVGGAFALMEMEAVLDEAAKAGRLAAVGPPERVRRRAVTLAPARGGEVRWS